MSSGFYKFNRLFDPNDPEPRRLSRSKIDLFLNCPRCFYLEQRYGVSRPAGYPFSLNAAVDALLKKEFDFYREIQEPHPLMIEHEIEAVPFKHPDMDKWRDSLRRGVDHIHPETNFRVTGGVDDVWINPKKELIVVDYKATAKNNEVNLDAEWQKGYKRQMEVYQWLFRKNGFEVSPIGYFVYANGRLDLDRFDAKLEFVLKVLPYEGNDSWIEPKLIEARECLMADQPPEAAADCEYCRYAEQYSARK
jgi:CRISPR/Cas system-associated exonuclease Cas4 (RecB family)